MLKPSKQRRIEYPSSDGKPIAENDINREDLVDAVKELGWWFRDRPDVYVSGDLLIFDTEGDPRRHLAPDVFVVIGAEKKLRDNYKLWEEPAPSLIIEIVSKSTWKEDLGPKKARYATWGVREYYVFDPKRTLFVPPMLGFTLIDGAWTPVHGPPFRSHVLGLDITADGDRLRFVDPATGAVLPTYDEIFSRLEAAENQARVAEKQARAAEEQARAAEEQVRAAEERARHLEAELRRLQGNEP